MYRDAYALALKSGYGQNDINYAAASAYDRQSAIVREDVPDDRNLQKNISVPTPLQAAKQVRATNNYNNY